MFIPLQESPISIDGSMLRSAKDPSEHTTLRESNLNHVATNR